MIKDLNKIQVFNAFDTVNSYFKKSPKWGLCNADTNEDILHKLKNFESMTWSEIVSASGGKSIGNNNHFCSKE